MVQLPIVKLSSLLIKTLSKPMSKRVKSSFKQYAFTKNILIGVGQMTHVANSRMTIWSAGYKVRNIQALEKEAALSQGADFIGEAFVFSVAGALVVWEYDKSKKKEKLKELKTEKEHQVQDDRIAKLEDRLVSLEDSIRANLNSILEQQRQSVEPEIKRRRGWLW